MFSIMEKNNMETVELWNRIIMENEFHLTNMIVSDMIRPLFKGIMVKIRSIDI